MNPYDLFVLASVGLIGAWGWHRGFLLMVGALLVALVAAAVAGHFATLVAGDPTEIGGSWLYNLVFFITFAAASMAGNVALKFADLFTDLPLVEAWKNWGGLVLGVLLGLFLTGIVTIVVTRFPLWEDLDEATTDSKGATISSKFALITVPFWPADLRNAYELVDKQITFEEQQDQEENEGEEDESDEQDN